MWVHPWECYLLLLLSLVLTDLRLLRIAAHDLDEVGFAFAEERGLEFEILVLQSLQTGQFFDQRALRLVDAHLISTSFLAFEQTYLLVLLTCLLQVSEPDSRRPHHIVVNEPLHQLAGDNHYSYKHCNLLRQVPQTIIFQHAVRL